MSDHDINGPSSLALREACPGSARMTAGIPKPPPNVDMERGTRLHGYVEAHLRGDPPLITDDAEAQAVLVCTGFAVATSDIAPPGALRLVEHKLDLSDLGITKGGTADYAVVVPGQWFHVVDWKFGAHPVRTPRWNRQLQAYAVGIAMEFGCIEGSASVVQPALDQPVSTGHFRPEDIATCTAELKAIVTAAKDPDAPLIPGEHCVRCPAYARCPSRQAHGEAIIARRPLPPQHAIRALPPEERLHYYQRLRLANAWVKSAVDDIDASILAGELDVPGLAVGEGRKSRVWSSESAAEKKLVELLGDGAYDKSLLSPAQAEKRVAAAKGKWMAHNELKDLIATKPGKPRIMRDGSQGLIEEAP